MLGGGGGGGGVDLFELIRPFAFAKKINEETEKKLQRFPAPMVFLFDAGAGNQSIQNALTTIMSVRTVCVTTCPYRKHCAQTYMASMIHCERFFF